MASTASYCSTDGAANLGDVEPESLKQKVEAQRKQGIASIASASAGKDSTMICSKSSRANGDGRYGFLNSPEEAASEFAVQLAGALKVAASDVKVQVEFNPKRVTSYRQIGYAKLSLRRNNSATTQSMPLKSPRRKPATRSTTVEVNPAGEGPLATVRVRYKIPGTTDYREQAWEVPFNGNAPAMEQSSPRCASPPAPAPLRVAGRQSARGRSPAGRIVELLSGVPEAFGADSRPKNWNG